MSLIPRYPGEGGATKIFWNQGEHPTVQVKSAPAVAYDIPLDAPVRSTASLMRGAAQDAPKVV